ncbi:MAG: peptidase MA family metallohydrolase [Anaerolineae bacterium]|nr:peptidase MA family metallohydrolase [Anaerolineae bacterium]
MLTVEGAPLQQGPPITVTAVGVEYHFGQQAVFTLEASAPAGIAALYLYLQKGGEDRVEVISVPTEGGASVRTTYARDLRLFPFPPFGEVRWWWEIRDGAGNSLTTDPRVFRYADNRFDWFCRTSESITACATADDPPYLQAALDVAASSLDRISHSLRVSPPERVEIYLYPSLGDLRAALEMAGREWMGGQARPELGVVLVAVPHTDVFVAQMEREIPHELTHLLVYRLTGPQGYPHVPAWLNEGLAVANQVHPDPSLEALLEDARQEGRLIPLEKLCSPFPSDPDVALLAYAQSGSLVRYIRKQYGDSGIRSLLAAYADGAGCAAGVRRALHLGLEQLERAWRADLAGLSGWVQWLSENQTALLLWGLSLLLAIPIALVARK